MGCALPQSTSISTDYDRPIEIAKGVFWVGFTDSEGRLQCNPYLIVDGDEAILIDGGSRPDFSTVMRKVLQTGIRPNQISHLIYQHYDPDLCGSIPNLEAIIDSPDLKVLSKRENNPFIKHYAIHSPLLCIDRLGRVLKMRSGRQLRFFPTPYSHSAGSFVTYDETTGVLFSSDLFGAAGALSRWKLFGDFEHICQTCKRIPPDEIETDCGETGDPCPWTPMYGFHREIMTCNKALRFALSVIRPIAPNVIAPQHGSILRTPKDIQAAIERLEQLDVGIDNLPQAAAFG